MTYSQISPNSNITGAKKVQTKHNERKDNGLSHK
nr:MAG TPA_asm: hypothetical protein [Caudoviricetes sp.]